MFLHKRFGGLSVPNLLKYYEALCLPQLTLVVHLLNLFEAPYSWSAVMWQTPPLKAKNSFYALLLWRLVIFKLIHFLPIPLTYNPSWTKSNRNSQTH